MCGGVQGLRFLEAEPVPEPWKPWPPGLSLTVGAGRPRSLFLSHHWGWVLRPVGSLPVLPVLRGLWTQWL